MDIIGWITEVRFGEDIWMEGNWRRDIRAISVQKALTEIMICQRAEGVKKCITPEEMLTFSRTMR